MIEAVYIITSVVIIFLFRGKKLFRFLIGHLIAMDMYWISGFIIYIVRREEIYIVYRNILQVMSGLKAISVIIANIFLFYGMIKLKKTLESENDSL